MLDYYAKRAPDYERIYAKPERQGDLAWLKARVGDLTRGARVLDLFAGTGALGLEALSRGAARVAFVDDGVAARALLRQNIEKARAMGVTDVWRRDATRLGENRGAPYGLIFLDPPYGKSLGEQAMADVISGG